MRCQCLLLLAVSVCCLATKPVINGLPSDEEGAVQVPAGSEYTFECEWDRPVTWVLPNNTQFRDYSNPLVDGRARVVNVGSGLPADVYRSKLNMYVVNYADTGEYVCRENSQAYSPSATAGLYMFVPGTTADTLMLHFASPLLILPLDVTRDALLDCKSTHPESSMHVYRDGRQIDNVRYDPRQGVTVPANTLPMSKGGTPYVVLCVNSVGSLSDRMNITILPREVSTFDVQIQPSEQTKHAYINGNISLDCVVDKLITINCTWTSFPAKDSDPFSDSHIFIHNSFSSGDKYIYRLEVFGITSSDRGLYSCACGFFQQDWKRATFRLEHVSSTRGQINIVAAEPSDGYVVRDESAGSLRLAVTFTAWPKAPPDYRWYHSYYSPLLPAPDTPGRFGANTTAVVSTSSGRISMIAVVNLVPIHKPRFRWYDSTGSDDLQTTALVINNIRPSDSGFYWIEMSAGGDLTIEAVHYNVSVTATAPSLDAWVSRNDSIAQKMDPRFLSHYGQYFVVAYAEGRPFPAAEILTAPFECGPDCQHWSRIADLSTTVLPGTFQQTTTVPFFASDNRYYRVVQGDVVQQLRLIVTEQIIAEEHGGMNLESQFDATNIAGIVYEHESLTVACVVQKYDFGPVFWYRMDRKSNLSVLIGGSNSTSQYMASPKIIWDTQSKYSNRLNMVFDQVQVSDSMVYRCESSLEQQPRVMTYNLTVKNIRPPHFLPTAFWPNSSQLHVNYTDQLILSCPFEGEPTPALTWYKDGVAFEGRREMKYNRTSATFTFTVVVESDAGVYTCNATNRGGTRSKNLTLYVDNGPSAKQLSKTSIWALCLSLLVATFLVVLLVAALVWQKYNERNKDRLLRNLYNELMNEEGIKLDPNQPVNNQAEGLPYDRKYELMKEQLQLGEVLGQGQFGKVLKGLLLPPPNVPATPTGARKTPLPVAVKIPQNGRSLSHQKALLDELKIMIHLGEHVNVLGLIGAVTKYMVKGELYVVVELCELGSVLTHLKAHRACFLDEVVRGEGQEPPQPSQQPTTVDGYLEPNKMQQPTAPSSVDGVNRTAYQCERDADWAAGLNASRNHGSLLTTSDLLSIGYQTANGMHFLAQKNLIHRDLATRNLLMTKERVVKIADFGLARQDMVYHIQASNVPLPMKWMALESILDHDFTVKSDVWSFGVVLWEIFSLGETPYPTVPLDPSFVTFLREGNRLQQPKYAPNEIYDVMRQCWLTNPTNRPSFAVCREAIGVQLQRCSPQLYSQVWQRVSCDAGDQTSESGTALMPAAFSDYVNWRPASYSIDCSLSSSSSDDSGSQAAVLPPFGLSQTPKAANGLVVQPQLHPHETAELTTNPGYMLQD